MKKKAKIKSQKDDISSKARAVGKISLSKLIKFTKSFQITRLH